MQIWYWSLQAILALIFYKAALSYYKAWRNKREAQERGCQLIPSYPHPLWDPLGLKMVSWFYGTRLAQKLPPATNELFEYVSSHEHRKVDTLMIYAVGSSRLWTSDPKNIEALQSSQFKDFELGPVRRGNFEPLLGRGVFNTNGKEWTYHRAISRPTFTNRQIEDMTMQETHLRNLLQALPVNKDGWTAETDLEMLLLRHAMDTTTDFLFGESANSQLRQLPGGTSPDLEKSQNPVSEQDFSAAWDVAQQGLMDRFQCFEAYWMLNPPSFRKACKTCHDFVDHYVELALKKTPSELEAATKHTFLDNLVQQTREPDELRAGMINMLQAGRDSSAATLGWLFMLLGQHQDVFKRLRGAMLDAFGTEARSVTYQSLRTCSYLQHCLQEALRLFPPIPVNASRTAIRDTTLPRGGGPNGQSPVFVPKGSAIDFVSFRTHRDPALWGDDAEVFRPERFESRKIGWEFHPFNGGPRACLGQHLAMASMGYVVARMLQTFDRVEFLGEHETRYNANLTMRSGNPVLVRLHKASE